MTDLRAEIRRQVRMFRDQPDIAADRVLAVLVKHGLIEAEESAIERRNREAQGQLL